MSSESAGRRYYDRDIPPVIETFLERRLSETRHLLRGEQTEATVALTNKITELTQAVADANLQAVEDHAEVKAKLSGLEDAISQLRPLVSRVSELEGHDRTEDAVEQALTAHREQLEKTRTQTRAWGLGLGGLIIAAAGLLANAISNLPG